ncbi:MULTISPECIES: hypothetical protein [Halobacterium]|uniref:hypothetical protein n=1 Tax=Halobacterium TaxID=2239 RepID=UPI00073E6A36|nr:MULTISPECIES: hypothetical protein [Halobacterium]MCG1002612.1 hypothetical protein [Halobacterium noricense]
MSDLSSTFGSWSDRVTYVLAEAQLLVAGVLVAAGVGIWWFNPSVPGAPPWTTNVLVGWLVLGPPMFIAGLRFVDWLRTRNYVEVHHINAVEDTARTYFVPPEVWGAKRVDGPAPYRMNDGDAIAVREFDWAPEYGDNGSLRVSGLYLSEMEDTKLLTSKAHMERMYEDLVDSHLSLAYLSESISDLSADLQTRLINRVVEAREKGERLDKDAVKDVTEEFRERAEGMTDDELSDITADDLPDHLPDALPAGETHDPSAGAPSSDGHGQTAADGGTQE